MEEAGLKVSNDRDIEHGRQFILQEDTKVALYDSGKVVVGGKQSAEKDRARAALNPQADPEADGANKHQSHSGRQIIEERFQQSAYLDGSL